MMDYELELIATCFLNYNRDEIMFRIVTTIFNAPPKQISTLYDPYGSIDDVEIIDPHNTEYIQKIIDLYISVFENIDITYLEAQIAFVKCINVYNINYNIFAPSVLHNIQ